ncbi:uncharacterized protein J4E84_011104 [Alternaria hordeiaustralica]|uniref:uncharacterized protein n=1 Tax=Alternaria hordeiaustralica TaxID=1187925 RepID=UPI0020C2CAD0|nr:uncharacterized protein J4E84_011104 [Alternaria hordeiaustralica]KAI4673425.1 hypothetical protein J4E84_011104 [Alternaria hordeiaustralica]
MEPLTPEQSAALAKDDRGPLTKSIVVAFTCIAVICVGLRLFTRLRYLGRALGWEDYTIVVSMALSIATGILQVMQANAGNGKHAALIEFPTGVEIILKYLFWSIICYNASLMFTKVSILLQYGRIFTVREMRIPLHIVMAVCVLWGVSTIITSIFTCVPVHAYWKILEQPTSKCIDNKTIWYVNASINIVTDLLVAFLPVRVIWTLQIAMRQKIALLAILTIGWFVCVVSILRLHALVVLVAHPDDNTYYSAPTAYWSAIEMNLAIVCASLPALKPLVVKIIPGFSSSLNASRVYGGGTGTGASTKQIGVRSTARRIDDDFEMGRPGSTTPYQTTSEEGGMFGKNIYVSRHFEQHFEQSSRISDSESQKDLVAEPKSVLH